MKDYKILYLGQKPIGEVCFDILLEYETRLGRIRAVCSNAGLATWWGTANIMQKSKNRGIPSIDNEQRCEKWTLKIIAKYGIDTIISVQHPWIISPAVLYAVNYNAYNLHLAKLPEYKGYYAPNFAILNGDEEFTVTIHRMADRLDSGAIIAERTLPITPHDTALSLYQKAEAEGIILFRDFLELNLLTGKLKGKPQRGISHFHGKNSLGVVREINDIHNLEEVERKARAFYFPPFEPAYVHIKNTVGWCNSPRKYYILPNQAGGSLCLKQ